MVNSRDIAGERKEEEKIIIIITLSSSVKHVT